MDAISLTIRIDENDKKDIKKLAKKGDRSISYVVNQAIKNLLKRICQNKKNEDTKKFLQFPIRYVILDIEKGKP